MENEIGSITVTVTAAEVPIENPESLLDQFKSTSTAARLSGSYNEAAGFVKRKLGEYRHDLSLSEGGRDQQLLGKIHNLVAEGRELKEVVEQQLKSKQNQFKDLVLLHAGNLIDGSTSFLKDIRTKFL